MARNYWPERDEKRRYDPLFSFYQTAGMLRDNIMRLKDLLHIYAMYHNQIIAGVKRPRLFNYLTPI